MSEISKIYCITKSSVKQQKKEHLFSRINILLQAGIRIIQLREKSISIDEYREWIQLYKPLCMRYQAQLIVNDHISVAIEEGVGLHIGWEDLELYTQKEKLTTIDALSKIRSELSPSTWLGLTVHSDLSLIQKVSHIVDYVGVGPIFATKTKLDVKTIVGTSTLQSICAQSKVNVVAVGGIKEENIGKVSMTGADFFAICSDIFDAPNLLEKIQNLSKGIQNIE